MTRQLPSKYSVLFAEWTRLLDGPNKPAADKYYFEELMPAILPIVEARSGVLPVYQGMISLLGFTPETVALTARVLRPWKLVVLHTPETEKFLDTAREYSGVPVNRFFHEHFLHDQDHLGDIYVALKNALMHFDAGDHIAIELTGGKKTMGIQLSTAAAAIRRTRRANVDVVYIDYDEYLPQYRKPVPESSRLVVIPDVPATVTSVFGEFENVAGDSREILVTPVFRGRGIPVDQSTLFVLMPFTAAWSDRVWRLVRQETSELGYTPTRADDFFGQDIVEDIWAGICRAGVVLADLTGRNPNVFYEIGIAHTLGKQCVLITQDLGDVPFDLSRYRCIEYEDNADGFARLKTGLQKALETLRTRTT